LGRDEEEYYRVLRSRGGCTDAEAAAVLGWPQSTVSARRNGCMQKWHAHIDREGGGHLIVDVGRRKNPSSGKRQIVWAVKGGVA
jgi:hypothetical protein